MVLAIAETVPYSPANGFDNALYGAYSVDVAQKQKIGKGGSRKKGRSFRKPAKQRYKSEGHRLRNKLKRIAKSQGEAAAKAYKLTGGTASRYNPNRTGITKGKVVK